MNVYILHGVVQYELNDMLGVYTTREAAIAARDAYAASEKPAYDWYTITRRDLDGAAVSQFDDEDSDEEYI